MNTRNGLTVSRRRAIGLVASAPLVTGGAAAVSAVPSRRARLEAGLQGISFRVAPSTLELVRLEEIAGPDRIRMTAFVRLIWPPGLRQRSFREEADGVDGADIVFERLENQILSYFSRL